MDKDPKSTAKVLSPADTALSYKDDANNRVGNVDGVGVGVVQLGGYLRDLA